MDASRDDSLAYMSFSREHGAQIASSFTDNLYRQPARCGVLISFGPLRGSAILHHAVGHYRAACLWHRNCVFWSVGP